MSYDRISVINSDGSTRESADIKDPDATLALLAETLGRTPTPSDVDGYGFQSWDWGGVALYIQTGPPVVSMGVDFTAAMVDGMTLSTPEGVSVGSPRDAVAKVASPGTEIGWTGNDGDVHTTFGLEARPHPGTESLNFPGQVAQDYLDVEIDNDVVTSIGSLGGDWYDL